MKKEEYKELSGNLNILNFVLFVVGVIIVWLATHNWIAVLGAIIASMHVNLPLEYLD